MVIAPCWGRLIGAIPETWMSGRPTTDRAAAKRTLSTRNGLSYPAAGRCLALGGRMAGAGAFRAIGVMEDRPAGLGGRWQAVWPGAMMGLGRVHWGTASLCPTHPSVCDALGHHFVMAQAPQDPGFEIVSSCPEPTS